MANFTLYGSLQPNDSIVNNLVSVYINEPDYDPFNEYIVFRSGQYDYHLCYSQSLSGDYKDIHYYAVQNGYNLNYYVEVISGSELAITYNGYQTCGNVQGSYSVERANNYKFQSITITLSIILVIAILFKTFRKRFKAKSGGWMIRG